MTQIRDALRDFNPWWGGPFELEFKERVLYKEIGRFVPLRQIIAFAGLRRVGKTTLMLKIVADAIKEGVDPKNVIYFSFDEFKEIEVREIMKAYGEMMQKNFRGEKFFLFLDEVQKLSNWEAQLKVIYDTFRNIKIIISGSESLFIRRKSKETLAGRIFEFKVEPLSFREFLSFKGVNFMPVGLHEEELRKLFNEFVLTMGFPELIGIKEKDIIKKYVRESIVEKIIYRDLTRLFKIKDVSIIESLLNIFLSQPGQIVELSELAGELGITRQTLSEYLSYLEDSFLVRKLYNFSKNRRKTERKLKKYYPTLVSVDLLFKEDEFSMSKVFEWLIVNQLKAEFFWRDAYKNEVDIVLANKEITAVEIKFGKIELKGLAAFLKKFKASKGVVVSSRTEKKQKIKNRQINIFPAFKFLLNQ